MPGTDMLAAYACATALCSVLMVSAWCCPACEGSLLVDDPLGLVRSPLPRINDKDALSQHTLYQKCIFFLLDFSVYRHA